MRDQYKVLSDNALALSEDYQSKSEKAHAVSEKNGFAKMAEHYRKESKKYLAARERLNG